MKKKTLIVTTNQVQKKLYSILSEKGLSCLSVESFNEGGVKELVKEFDTLILPFPSKKENLNFLPADTALGDYLTDNQLVIGGLFAEEIINDIKKSKGEYIDYFKNEAYVLKNAYITSQGALRLLLETTSDYIVGKKVLITGFGRIGKSLAHMLKSIGMKVFVAVRSETAAAEALACGFEVFKISQMHGTLFYYDYIFNTVPERIFEKHHIKRMREDAYYFELASYPFGADEVDFVNNGKRFINGSALPGRYFPLAVAENIANFIFSLRG